jgi:2-dehydro-3-deoxyphosphooctonate aldolase (KDO 8-P synthase)
MPIRTVPIGPHRLGAGRPLYFLGPCVIESPRMLRTTARQIAKIAKAEGVAWVLKASYDKANRTSIRGFRGMDAAGGCALLAEIGAELGVPVMTDVHSPEDAEIAGHCIDVLQIPAFLCRQTDLVLAAAETGRVVNVKKGQFLAPWDLGPIAEKILSTGNRRFFFTERGTTFGYNNLVADMRSLAWIREAGHAVVFDATHSVQRPGGAGDSTSGDGVLAPVLARAAMAAGCDGIFLESHPRPERALSDGPNQIPLRRLGTLLRQLGAIHHALAS